MTDNNNLKQRARAYAAEHGVAYAQARREVLAQQEAPDGFTSRRMLTIQQAQREDGVLPYPFFVDQNGFIDRQDFWRGDPFRLIGFVTDPDSFEVAVHVEDFVKNPTSAVGMHLVLSDREGGFATYSGAVESVKTSARPVAKSESVTLTVMIADFGRTETFGVGHLMWLLNSHDFDGDMAEGRVRPQAAAEMLGWLMRDTGGQDPKVLEDIYEDLDLVVDPLTGNLPNGTIFSIDPVEVRAWFVAKTPKKNASS